MHLTERDRSLLQWINGHGFVTIDQAAKWKLADADGSIERLIGDTAAPIHQS